MELWLVAQGFVTHIKRLKKSKLQFLHYLNQHSAMVKDKYNVEENFLCLVMGIILAIVFVALMFGSEGLHILANIVSF